MTDQLAKCPKCGAVVPFNLRPELCKENGVVIGTRAVLYCEACGHHWRPSE